MALSLYRYSNWIEIIAAGQKELLDLQGHLNTEAERLVYAYLEAREEQEHLIARGLNREQIESVGVIPPLPTIDPLAILKRVGTWTTGTRQSSADARVSVTSPTGSVSNSTT